MVCVIDVPIDYFCFVFDLESSISACNCDLKGSVDDDCDPCTSQCKCRPSVGGLNCDECLDGFFGFNGPNGCESKLI